MHGFTRKLYHARRISYNSSAPAKKSMNILQGEIFAMTGASEKPQLNRCKYSRCIPFTIA